MRMTSLPIAQRRPVKLGAGLQCRTALTGLPCGHATSEVPLGQSRPCPPRMAKFARCSWATVLRARPVAIKNARRYLRRHAHGAAVQSAYVERTDTLRDLLCAVKVEPKCVKEGCCICPRRCAHPPSSRRRSRSFPSALSPGLFTRWFASSIPWRDPRGLTGTGARSSTGRTPLRVVSQHYLPTNLANGTSCATVSLSP